VKSNYSTGQKPVPLFHFLLDTGFCRKQIQNLSKVAAFTKTVAKGMEREEKTAS
jgi:hypothetical protein